MTTKQLVVKNQPVTDRILPQRINYFCPLFYSSGKMISSFVSVIEDTKDLSLSEEKQRSPQQRRHSSQPPSEAGLGAPVCDVQDGLVSPSIHGLVKVSPSIHGKRSIPVPAKCSTQLKKLLHSHSIQKPPSPLANGSPGAPGGLPHLGKSAVCLFLDFSKCMPNK